MRQGFRYSIFSLLVLAAVAHHTSPAVAQESLPPDEPWRYAEVRLGLLAHDVAFAGGFEGGVDINGEIDSPTLVNPDWTANAPIWLQWVLHPRAHFGFDLNTNGRTNQIFAGVTWTAVLTRDVLHAGDAFEFSFLFGPALNDGEHSPDKYNFKALGSNVLFHLGGEISYRVTPSIALGVYFDHSSNAGFARYNASLNDFGLRVGYRF